MARYNTSQASKVITGTTTIVTPDSGAFVQLSGTSGYTVTLPAPAAFPGSNFTFYNATNGTNTLSTPSGAFNGTGGSAASTVSIFSGNVISLTSDGTNYIVISEDGSPLIATTGSFSSNVDVNGTLTVNPSGGVSMSPSTVGSINNVTIGGTTRATGSFTALTANGATTFTANTPSTTTSSGTVVITGGLGVSGTINAASVSASLTGTIQTAAQPNITSVGTLSSLAVSGALTAGSFTVPTAAQPNITSVGTLTGLTVTNTITGSVSGSAATATTAGTVTTAAQPNITSVGTLTGLNVSGDATIPKHFVNRSGVTGSGISWYSSSYTSWADYMSPAGAANSGPTANITAPSGTLVTSWGRRSFIENASGYGWTFESGTAQQTTPTVVAEIRSSDGSARFNGQVTKPNQIFFSATHTGGGDINTNSATKVTGYSTVQQNVGSAYSGPNSRFTATVAGVYLIRGQA
jgi:hypothetical protein